MGAHEAMESGGSELTRRDLVLGGCLLLACLIYTGVLILLVEASIGARMGSAAGEAARHLLARFMVLPAVVLLWRFPQRRGRVMFGIVTFCACFLIGDAVLRFVPHL